MERTRRKDEPGETIFEGEYFMGIKHGFGRLTLPNESFFYGHWNHGKKNKIFLHFDSLINQASRKFFQNDIALANIEEGLLLYTMNDEYGYNSFIFV